MRSLLYLFIAIFSLVAAAWGGFLAGVRVMNLERLERQTEQLDEERHDELIRGKIEALSLIRLGKADFAATLIENTLSQDLAFLFVCSHESCVVNGILSARRLATLNQVKAYFDVFPPTAIPDVNFSKMLRAIPKSEGIEMTPFLRELLSSQAKSD